MLAYVIENYIRGDKRVQSSLGSENRLETSKDAVLKRRHTETKQYKGNEILISVLVYQKQNQKGI